MNRWKKSVLAAVALGTLAAPGVQAQSILISQSGCAGGYGYGCGTWTSVTNAINTAFAGNVTVTADFTNYAQMLAYDALWLDQRGTTGALSGTEATNLMNYIATGRRVVMIGENASWTPWNQQLAGIVGGTYAGDTHFGVTNTVYSHDLTAGVTSIYVPAGGELAGVIGDGGVSLFAAEVATLWGPSENALVMLDVNVWSNSYVGTQDNNIYLNNTTGWLAGGTVTPEPITMTLLGTGLAGVAAARRRRKSAS